jgi:uncharacterized damage-inducible protein DinB
VERLRGTPARLEERVESLAPENLTRRVGDCWSIQENVGHLLDLEPLWAGRLEDLMSGTEVMRPADLENTKTHEANHNKASITYLLSTFREMRLRFVDQLDALDEASVLRSARHPRLEQPMRTLDLVFFVAEHDDHHLAWITELRRSFSV